MARYFRAFGFFESFPPTEEGITDAIKSYWGNDWRDHLAGVSDRAAADQWLLVADTKRIWWHDLEGVYPGANYYVEVLKEWSAISRGQFFPEQVQETWHSDHGPAEVTFIWSDNIHTFIHQSGDYMEHGILQLINHTLLNKTFRFEVATDYGDSNWITMLSPDEKQRLKSERGWHFLW